MLPDIENTTTVMVTAVELIILATAVGVVAGDLWVLPLEKSVTSQQIPAKIRVSLWKVLGLCLIAFTLTSLTELVLRTSSMSDLPVREAFSEIDTVLLKTHYGHLWLWRSAALLLAWIAWGTHLRSTTNRVIPVTAFIALVGIVITISAAGHAGDDGFLAVANLANSLHILGAFLWGGGIIATVAIIFPLLLHAPTPVREVVAIASLRLSTLAGTALGLVLIPGLYNAWLQIDSWHGLWSTVYGQVLMAKVALVMGMIVLGALNRYLYIPAIQRHVGRPEPRMLFTPPRFLRIRDETTSVPHFFRSLRVEAALLLGVLILAAVLSQQTPAVHVEHENMMQHKHDEN